MPNKSLSHPLEQEKAMAAVEMPERDAEGYLIDPGNWNEEIAKALARDENINLSDDHWGAIHFMREFYEEHRLPLTPASSSGIWPNAWARMRRRTRTQKEKRRKNC